MKQVGMRGLLLLQTTDILIAYFIMIFFARPQRGEWWMLDVMTWEELRDLLVDLSEETRVASTHGVDAVALNLPPEEWFISMRFTNALSIGRYEGDELRLVGTEQLPLSELTAAFVQDRVEQAMARQVRGMLDPEAVELFGREMKKRSDIHRDHDLG